MAEAEKELLFESFLKKRKDTMKFTWSKYWFRLRNTTLSFYTGEEADETCLRGKYYIHLVQSVREVKASESNYTFEIVMKNGKRKLLSADSANLRKVWIEYLWKSMQLPSPGRKNSSCTWHDLPSLEPRTEAAGLNKPDSRSELGGSVYEQLSSRSDALVEGNKNNSEHGDSSSSNVPQLKSDKKVAEAEQENESYSSEEESNIYDIPKLMGEGERNKTGFEEKSNGEPKHFDLYDIPDPEKTLNMTTSAVLGGPCDGEDTSSVLPEMNNTEATPAASQGEAIDDVGEQSTDSDSGPPDEIQGVSNV